MIRRFQSHCKIPWRCDIRFQDLGQRGVLQKIDPALIIEEPGWNERRDNPNLDAHIKMLMGSIRAIGVKEPLTVYVRGEELVLTNGHCRLLAVKRLIAEGCEILTVPVCVEPQKANDADRVLSMITRNNGKPLEPIESAAVFKRLVAFGWDTKAIASKTGFSVGYVSSLLNLTAAPEEIQGMVSRGEVSASTAAKVIRQKGKEAPATLKKAVKVANDHGLKKASAKHLERPAVDWFKVGPKLQKHLQSVLDHEAGASDLALAFMVATFPE